MVLAMAVQAADGDVAAECVGIAAADERLACFDAAYGVAPKAPGTTAATLPAAAAATPAITDTTAATAVKPSEADFGRQKSKAELEGESISSAVVSVDKDAYGKRIFELENGQVWRQTESDHFRAKPGDVVEVRHGTFGSYKLSVDGESYWTRVRRVE